jgi:hypothetical protein
MELGDRLPIESDIDRHRAVRRSQRPAIEGSKGRNSTSIVEMVAPFTAFTPGDEDVFTVAADFARRQPAAP